MKSESLTPERAAERTVTVFLLLIFLRMWGFNFTTDERDVAFWSHVAAVPPGRVGRDGGRNLDRLSIWSSPHCTYTNGHYRPSPRSPLYVMPTADWQLDAEKYNSEKK